MVPLLAHSGTPGDSLSPGSLAAHWDLDPLVTSGLLAAAALYLRGVSAVRARGGHWPAGFTVAFVAGLAALGIALLSGVAANDWAFRVHAVQHLLLGLAAPLLLVLGRPAVLAMRAGGLPRRLVLGAIRSRLAGILHPLPAWLVFVAHSYALYFTELHPLTLRHDAVHEVVHGVVLASGLTFFSAFVVPPVAPRLPAGMRAAGLVLALPPQAFLAVALLASDGTRLTLLSGQGAVADQHLGAGVLWLGGGGVLLAALAVVLAQWMAVDRRTAAAEDRRTARVETA